MNLGFTNGFALAFPVSIALLAACGGTADVGSDKSGVNNAGSGNETGGSAGVVNVPVPGPGGGPGEAGASQGGAAQGGAPQGGTAGSGHAGMAGAGQAGSGAGGGTCGGLIGAQCATDEWCDFGDNEFCGAADAMGVCHPRPQVCDTQYDPVCGCDGNMYGNSCAANAAGTDATSDTSCFPKDGGTAPGGLCKSNSDCRLVDDYCGGCNCLALGPGQSAPKCSDPVQCLRQPCGGMTVACVSGSCVAQ